MEIEELGGRDWEEGEGGETVLGLEKNNVIKREAYLFMTFIFNCQ